MLKNRGDIIIEQEDKVLFCEIEDQIKDPRFKVRDLVKSQV